MKRLVVVFVCLFCVAGAYSEATSFSPQSSSDSDIARSENDQSVYRHLTLPNSLQVLLVSDPDADKAAAALDGQHGQDRTTQTSMHRSRILVAILATKRRRTRGRKSSLKEVSGHCRQVE